QKSNLGLILSLKSRMKASGSEVLISFLSGANIKSCCAHFLYPHFKLIVSERNFSLKPNIGDRFRHFLYRQACRIVCNNYSQEEYIRALTPSLAAKLTTVPNFVDLETFSPAVDPSAKNDVSGAGIPLTVVTTARLCRRKNALGLIEAARILKSRGCTDIRFRWYGHLGADTDSYYRQCVNLIADLNLGDMFEIHQAVHEVAPLYRSADIFCLPSFYEGTSNSIAEALACGIPVAVSAVSDNSRYVHEGESGVLFNPNAPESIAEALIKLASMTAAERTALGVAGRRIVSAELSPAAFNERWGRIISQIAKEDER
ncbi:MAG: glycosyltransferase family 4 protein, partial [Bacteroidales bacterium]|nr:glycosyltransferase family 4 protein [Bacteroidales bacterium]